MEKETRGVENRIKELRKAQGMTQKEFAAEIGIKPVTLASYEQRKVSPSVDVALRIANRFNVSLDWLLKLDVKNSDNITTLSDLFKIFINLEKSVRWLSPCDNFQDGWYEVGMTGQFSNYMGLTDEDGNIINFFNDWGKMSILYKTGAIDDEVYSLWIEKTLNKYRDYDLNGKEIIPF